MNVPLKMFVLGVMLDDILSRANVYFTTLSGGRYQLSRKREGQAGDTSGLDLEIYDAYSGAAETSTPFPAESCFWRPCLWLLDFPMWCKATRRVRLESIFIDEGFWHLG